MEEPVNLESSSEALSKRLKANTKRIKRKHQRIKGIPAQLNLYQLSQYVNKRSILAQTDLYQLSGMPTETPREVRFNFKIGSNGLQNSQNLSHSFAIPWWVFNQKIKTSLWISWVLKGARKRWGTQEHPQSPKREIWQKKWSKSNDFLAVASQLYSESLPKRSL